MNKINWSLTTAIVLLAALLAYMYSARLAHSRDLGQWDDVNHDAATRDWFKKLMRPPPFQEMSCCAEADAYYADEVHVRDGKTFATITDDRPDDPLGRPHVAVGTEIEVTADRLKWDRGNPTGHNVIFLGGGAYGHWVYCFVQNGGV